jgi:hypothetical protein
MPLRASRIPGPPRRSGPPAEEAAPNRGTAGTVPRLGSVRFTVPDAHLLALQAHATQVDARGRDHYLAHVLPIAQALRRYGPQAEMAGALHDLVDRTREDPDPAAATSWPVYAPSPSPRSSLKRSTPSLLVPGSPTTPA